MNNKFKNEYNPPIVTPPGETLADLLEERGMTQSQLAERTGRAEKTINQIIKGKAPIAPETALQFERALGVPASFWNAREKHYREALARVQESKNLKDQTSWLKIIPTKYLVRYEWVDSDETGDKVFLLREVLRFFGVASPKQWEELWRATSQGVVFRRSRIFQSDPGALAAWLRMGEIIAQDIKCAKFNEKKFKRALSDIRNLSRDDNPSVFLSGLRDICSKCGVAFVLVRELPRTSTSGAARWLTPQKALIQLSLRYKSDDQLWFSFFHEAGHILLHGKKGMFLDLQGSKKDADKNKDESEANAFAAEILIPRRELRKFLEEETLDAVSIRRFARKLGIAPGIVIGRLQHDGMLSFATPLNYLKRRYKWKEN